MKPAWRVVAALVALSFTGLCVRDRLSPRPPPTVARRGDFSSLLSESLEEQTRSALARDARRREARFLDAVRPGHALAATRVDTAALAAAPPDTVYELGARLFHHHFKRTEGLGARDLPAVGRVHRGRRGGPDAYSCRDCHRRGGPAGAGDAADNAYLDGDGERPSSAIERNPPALVGAGILELCASEMTRELRAGERRALGQARRDGKPVTVELVAKGVSFGELTARPGGTVDRSKVRGVDRDLVVKPFGWKGHAATLREVVEDELALHHGLQTTELARSADPRRLGPFGGKDPDGDGVQDEITEGQLTALTLFVAMQEVPVVEMPRSPAYAVMWSDGQLLFRKLGCAGCHVPSLPLDDTVYRLAPRDGGPAVRVDLAKHGAEPRLARAADGRYHVYLFSDLRRHVVGPNLREARSYRGVSAAEVLTPALWGVARSRPYLHDARAPELNQAILEHSGEALRAARAYAKLSDEERAPLRMYLMTLTRALRVSVP